MEARGNRDKRGRRNDRRPTSRPPSKPPQAPRSPERSVDEHLSRFLAFVLRHHPEEINLTLDERGAADLDALAEAVKPRRGFENVTREKIVRLAATGPAAQRFEIIGNRIRALYGHTLPQAVQYESARPPKDLFHGTTPENAQTVLAEGLKPADRQRVHLSIDTPAAREVGQRRCPNPVILRVDTAGARKAGVQFYCGGPAVWLSDAIPPECITQVE